MAAKQKPLSAKAQKENLAQRFFLIQAGKCQLCGKKLDNKTAHAVLDTLPWDTTTVRGLIHSECKAAVKFVETQALLKKLRSYLGVTRLDCVPQELREYRKKYK